MSIDDKTSEHCHSRYAWLLNGQLNLAITWLTVLTFMIIHLFWFRLADDEQDWWQSWLIQLRTGSRVVSSVFDSKRVVHSELKDALETALGRRRCESPRKSTMDLARKRVCSRISHCRAQSPCAGGDGLMMEPLQRSGTPKNCSSGGFTSNSPQSVISPSSIHSYCRAVQPELRRAEGDWASLQIQSGTGPKGAVPQSVSLRDWGLWIWPAFCTGDESMSPGVNVLGAVPCASCCGSGSSPRFDIAASVAVCCGSSLALSQVQFSQGCRHGCYHATGCLLWFVQYCVSWRSLSCSSLQWYGADRTDRLGPRVIRSRQSFE